MGDERDAFGREIEDDPLADMGWSPEAAPPAERVEVVAGDPLTAPPSEPEQAPASTPPRSEPLFSEPEPAPYYEPPPPPEPMRPVRTFRIGWLVKLLIVGSILVAGAAIAIPVFNDVKDAIDDAVDEFESGTDQPGGGQDGDESGQPPQGLQRKSMLLRGNLAPGLRTLQREIGGDLRFVRIEAERVDVQAADGNELVLGQASWDGQVRVLARTRAAIGDTFSWSRVDPSAPRRFVQRVTRSAGRPSSDFNYAVLIDAAGLRWQIFLKDGTHYTASLNGRDVERQ